MAAELIFLGTGTSSSLPNISCLTNPNNEGCKTCLSTLTPEGKHNIRRNTSAAIRLKDKEGQPITIVIDSGKTFQAAALEWFPKYGLRRIDALLLTHAHADAMNGLDDLRGWTLGGAIQDHVDVYLSQDTFQVVQKSFPYLVSKEFASGGGDVPDFVWHIIDDAVPFEINNTGVMVTPFSVHHGRIFSTVPVPAFAPTPMNEIGGDGTPVDMFKSMSIKNSLSPNTSLSAKVPSEPVPSIQPYLCFGYKFEDLVYISDVSHIPEPAWSIIRGLPGSKPPSVCVLDCLGPRHHASHFALDESVKAARQIGATRSYFVGFSHRVSHEEYVTITETLGGMTPDPKKELSPNETRGIDMLGEGEPIWARPAHDGLKVVVEDNGVRDETYDLKAKA